MLHRPNFQSIFGFGVKGAMTTRPIAGGSTGSSGWETRKFWSPDVERGGISFPGFPMRRGLLLALIT